MPQVLGGVDVETVSVIAGAITVFVGGTVGGVRMGLKKVRGEAEEGSRIVGGSIMSSLDMALLSERLREGADAMRENTAVSRELAHQVERLRDKMS